MSNRHLRKKNQFTCNSDANGPVGTDGYADGRHEINWLKMTNREAYRVSITLKNLRNSKKSICI